jgi:hypothetical protein
MSRNARRAIFASAGTLMRAASFLIKDLPLKSNARAQRARRHNDSKLAAEQIANRVGDNSTPPEV